MPARAVAIVNKWYECDPFLATLLNANARSSSFSLTWRAPLAYPRLRSNSPTVGGKGEAFLHPRAVFELAHGVFEVWCVSDLLEDLPDLPDFQSNSQAKAVALPAIFRSSIPQLAVGTAALAVGPEPRKARHAGGDVLIGSTVFMHDFHPEAHGQRGHWDSGPFDTILPSSLPSKRFDEITSPIAPPDGEATKRLFLPPLAPARGPRIFAGAQLTAVGSLNVSDPHEYTAADKAALHAYQIAGGDVSQPRSVETTHGLIRVQSDAPFLFVSGIANRALASAEELLPRKYAQDTVAASNAGMAILWMLPQINSFLGASERSDGSSPVMAG